MKATIFWCLVYIPHNVNWQCFFRKDGTMGEHVKRDTYPPKDAARFADYRDAFALKRRAGWIGRVKDFRTFDIKEKE